MPLSWNGLTPFISFKVNGLTGLIARLKEFVGAANWPHIRGDGGSETRNPRISLLRPPDTPNHKVLDRSHLKRWQIRAETLMKNWRIADRHLAGIS